MSLRCLDNLSHNLYAVYHFECAFEIDTYRHSTANAHSFLFNISVIARIQFKGGQTIIEPGMQKATTTTQFSALTVRPIDRLSRCIVSCPNCSMHVQSVREHHRTTLPHRQYVARSSHMLCCAAMVLCCVNHAAVLHVVLGVRCCVCV